MNIRNLRVIVLGLTLVLSMGIFSGCAKEAAPVQTSEEGSLEGEVAVVGSTSVTPLAQEIADAFMLKNPGVRVDVQGVGSTAGVKAASEGAADIGMASRDLKTEEKGWGLDEHIIAYDGIAVVVHPTNEVGDLDPETVKAIFKGEITNWKEVGGADEEILIVSREEGSGTRGAFEELLEIDAVKEDALIAEGNGSVKANIASKTYGIGYISLSYVDETVKTVEINGVEPTVDNILAGSYKVSRPFLMLTKGENSGIAKAYLDFIFSEEGQAIVSEKNIPVK
ncbi:MAG: phosphate ABC transporter substrate-binding protein [Peptostreptococcaceae bacterium]|nr:phosphate ABC transporter substrate-binding protein [Peptostreptococcaceae bacterium]